MKHIVDRASAIDGWMGLDELEWLALMASTRHTIVEIGSWKGRSTKALAMATPGVVFAVDHWKGSESERAGPHKEALDRGPDAFFEIFRSNLSDEIACGKVMPVRAESGEAVNLLGQLLSGRGGKADMVFIDGDHPYESVKRDIQNYMPMLTHGGLLCGHDYSTAFEGIMRAVNELVPGWRIGTGSIWCGEV